MESFFFHPSDKFFYIFLFTLLGTSFGNCLPCFCCSKKFYLKLYLRVSVNFPFFLRIFSFFCEYAWFSFILSWTVIFEFDIMPVICIFQLKQHYNFHSKFSYHFKVCLLYHANANEFYMRYFSKRLFMGFYQALDACESAIFHHFLEWKTFIDLHYHKCSLLSISFIL